MQQQGLVRGPEQPQAQQEQQAQQQQEGQQVLAQQWVRVAQQVPEQQPALVVSTTASVDGGTANSGYTWFEQGFHPTSPDRGLPPAGCLAQERL